VVFEGMLRLGEGAVLAGMMLGAIAVFLIDRRFYWAAGYSFLAAGLASIGLIHGPEIDLFATPEIPLGYAFLGLTCLAFAALRVPEREIDYSDPADVEQAAERAPVIEAEQRELVPV
jgi:adenine/guanine/hypoxanthine permease